jgi:hypothetical protein
MKAVNSGSFFATLPIRIRRSLARSPNCDEASITLTRLKASAATAIADLPTVD